MLALLLGRRKKYNISLVKTIIITVLLTVLGLGMTELLYFIENGEWGGKSFFGAVLFIPVVFPAVALALKIPCKDMMDFISLPGLMMFALLKINCAISGCCGGRLLYCTTAGDDVYFPSPAVEAITTVLLVGVLLYFEYINKTRGNLYPISLITYGILRFALNFLRMPGEPFFLGLQQGTVWSIVSIIFGVVWILINYYKKIDRDYKSLNEEQ